MALTPAGVALATRFLHSQTTLRAGFLKELLRLWPLLNPLRLDETAATWLQLMVDLVLTFRATSVRNAVDYYDRFRSAEIGAEALDRARFLGLDAVNHNRIITSLAVTGPIGIKHRTGHGVPVELATKKALVEVSGAAGRHVLDGGRQILTTLVHEDKLATGFARVTSDNPCYFCAMLASRGPVYLSRESAELATERSERSGQEYHDNCDCTVEPAFTRDENAPWPGRGREFEQLWKKSTKGVRSGDMVRAFRCAYEGREFKPSR